MSQKRHPEENLESPDALRALFVNLCTNAGRCNAYEIWRTVISDPWLKVEIRRRAEFFASSHGLDNQVSDDIAQEVVVLLAAKLVADPTMHANAELLPSKFEAWIGTILDHACSRAARLIGAYRKRLAKLADVTTVEDDVPYNDCRFDLAAAVATLTGRELLVMTSFLSGLEPNVIAEQLHLSYKQVAYAISKATPRLKPLLKAYDTGRV
jgi:DNA-directed RNA polymerase specialized sigma24 family protein